MIEDMGHGGHELGYYAGGLAASFCGAQFCSSVAWGIFSDRYGRKPAIILGTFGAGVGMLIFGTAKVYWQAVLGRVIGGLLCGNLGVLKSLLTEITDDSNRALGFSYLSVAWSVGTLLAPLAGGLLCNPHVKYPTIISSDSIFATYPYLLPCFICVINSLVTCLLCFVFLQESRIDYDRIATSTNKNNSNSSKNKKRRKSIEMVKLDQDNSSENGQQGMDTSSHPLLLLNNINNHNHRSNNNNNEEEEKEKEKKDEELAVGKLTLSSTSSPILSPSSLSSSSSSSTASTAAMTTSSSSSSSLSSSNHHSPLTIRKGNQTTEKAEEEQAGYDERKAAHDDDDELPKQQQQQEQQLPHDIEEGNNEEEEEEEDEEELCCDDGGGGCCACIASSSSSPSLTNQHSKQQPSASLATGDYSQSMVRYYDPLPSSSTAADNGNLAASRLQKKNGTIAADKAAPVSILRHRIVLLATGNYGMLCMAYILLDETIPLFLKLSISQGGLAFSSSQIGLLLSLAGGAMLIFNMLFLPVFLRASKKWLYELGILCALPLAIAWPSIAVLHAYLLHRYFPQSLVVVEGEQGNNSSSNSSSKEDKEEKETMRKSITSSGRGYHRQKLVNSSSSSLSTSLDSHFSIILIGLSSPEQPSSFLWQLPAQTAAPLLATSAATSTSASSSSSSSSSLDYYYYGFLWPVLILIMILKSVAACLSFTAVMLQVNHCVTEEHLGKANGLGQTLASLARAIGPALGGMLWSIAIQRHFLFLNFLSVVILLICSGMLNRQLPNSIDHKKKSKKDRLKALLSLQGKEGGEEEEENNASSFAAH